ncbi:BOS complex subunit TMEM147-like [Hydractinia symbiolongicarpus]|uniref:BOS complex subunit TMEM147-like n=1 Tax=Hydractinia symbiolongicarpus TaxID=13093 RepID=UPI00254D1133|nr:BOS complex subunit TMEM147-like [Hydractinia symbiolongicarpus]
MTLFHFGNCLALSIGPYFILYKCSGLSEYQTIWKLGKAGLAYFLTQLCKMLVLATFFPMTESTSTQHIDILSEFLKSTMDLSDLLGLHLLMLRIPGRGELKVLVAGLGWASSEFLTTKLIPLWVGARAIEFNWIHTQLSFDTNISLVLYLTIAALIWLWSRTDLQKVYSPVVVILLALCCYRPLVLEIMSYMFHISSWSLLIFKAVYTCGIGALALQIYIGLVKTLKTY